MIEGVAHWEQAFAARPTGEPAWLAERRAQAFAAFAAQGFPRFKAPGWRHTNIAPLARVPFDVRPGEAPAFEAPPGVTITDLRAELRGGAADVRDALRAESAVNGPFTALNLAFVEAGTVIRIAPKTRVTEPIVLNFASTGGATHFRTLVFVGALSEAVVVEHYAGGSGEYLVNAVSDVFAGPGSRVVHARLQEDGAEAWHIADVRARLERDARLLSLSVALGSKLSRTGLHAVLDGEGAEADLLGLYFGRDRQHQDHTTVVEHNEPHGTSRERYKGILDDASRGVFSALVRVAEGAVKTDASQDNRNLILSDRAHADSEPQLEIHTDDLKASHASAIGRLDDEALFYLRSRGIDLIEARRLLTRAFAADLLADLPPAVKELVEGRVATWLGESRGAA